MKKIIKIFAGIALMVVLVFGANAMAANYGLDSAAKQANYIDENGSGKDIWGITELVVKTMLIVIAFVFFGYFTYAGLRWMTARGNQEFIERAKGTMEASIIGFVIVMAAYAITNFIFNKF